ncbi:MAG: tyrosine transporter [Nitrosomonas sp.]|nr:MAG: tyrosine transporter [Nitrosomonas sp.]
MHRSSKTTGGILLVAGTAIGAGMLALPVSTGLAGFLPAQILFVLCWLFMTYTAFLILEVNLWMRDGANMITMAKRTLGPIGRFFAWGSYLFLLYSLLTAYIAVSGSLTQEFIKAIFGIEIPASLEPIPLLIIFSYFVSRGVHAADHFNRWLMIGMAIAYAVLMVLLAPHIDIVKLNHYDWKYTVVGVSVVATAFGFHIIIPTLTTYLQRDVSKLRRVLFIGSAVPLVIYTIWQLLALGIIPDDALREGYLQGTNSAVLVAGYLDNPFVQIITRFFAFTAVVTSFLVVSLSLWDCLADGFKVSKNERGRLLLYVLTFMPPLCFALTNPRAFLSALEYAGAFGVVILLCLLPALMVWWGRYRLKLGAGVQEQYQVVGGKIALVAVILISLTVIAIEVLIKIGIIEKLLF